jgi:EpsI family protein
MSESTTSSASPATSTRGASGPSLLQLSLVVAILGGGVVLTALTSNVAKETEPGVKLVDGQLFLPVEAGPWQGSEISGLTKEERAVLPADTEGTRRTYKDAAGHEVYCSVILAGRDVTSIHRPELCLTGQGWRWTGVSVASIPTPAAAGGKLRVTRLDAVHDVLLKGGQVAQAQSIFVYWFVGKDRTTPYHWQRILWTTMDRVFHNRNHRWAYFLIHVPVTTTRAAAMQTVNEFVQDIYPALVLK